MNYITNKSQRPVYIFFLRGIVLPGQGRRITSGDRMPRLKILAYLGYSDHQKCN